MKSTTTLATVLLMKKRLLLSAERTIEEESNLEYEKQTFRDEDRSAKRPFCSSYARALGAGETVGSEVAYSSGNPINVTMIEVDAKKKLTRIDVVPKYAVTKTAR